MIRPLDVVRLALSVLRERRVRAALTMIGIAIGPAAMVAIIGTVEGYSQVITGQLNRLGQNTLVVLSTENYALSDNDIRYIRGLHGVSKVIPFYLMQATFRRGDGKLLKVNLYATDVPSVLEVIGSLEIREGRIPPYTAYSSGLIGYDIAFDERGRQLVEVGQAITVMIPVVEGDRVRLRARTIRVSGILEKYGNALVMNPDATIFLPMSAGPAILGVNKYSGLLVSVASSEEVGELTSVLRRRYEGLAEVISFQQIANVVGSIIRTMNFLLYSLSLAAFVVAITGIMATMFTSVVERTREIGVLKALGYTRTQILILILAESVIISLLGGALGVSLGTVGAYVLSSRSFKMGSIVILASPAITPYLIGESIGLAVLVGVAGGLVPAYKASRIPPVEALRYE